MKIQFPTLLDLDTGIHRSHVIEGTPRFKVWFRVNGKRRYVTLPKGTTIEEARTRRDNLYRNLKQQFKATKARKKKSVEPQPQPYRKQVAVDTYVYKRDPWIVRIMGKQIGTAKTKIQAVQLRDKWLLENREKVPHIRFGEKYDPAS